MDMESTIEEADFKKVLFTLNEKQRRLHFFKKNYKKILVNIDSYNILFFKIDNFTQKLYNYLYELIEIPVCTKCETELKFKGFTKGYGKYCNSKCAMNDKSVIEKRNKKSIDTNIERYGVNNPMKVKEIRDKVINTNIERYGVTNYTKTKKYKDNIILYNRKMYDEDWYLSTTDFKKKSKETNIVKYGVEHHTKNIEFKDKCKISNIKKWGVDNYTKTKSFKSIMDKYYHSDKFKRDSSIMKEKYKLNIFDYYKNYNNSYQLLSIINNELSLKCNVCNNSFDISKQLYYLRNKNENDICTICNPREGKNTSYSEKSLLEFIKEIYKLDIIENFKIDKNEIDIFLPYENIGFEFNGLYWHSEIYKDKKYHINKSEYFNSKNIRIIHIWEDDWNFKKNIVKSMILNIFGKSDRIFARDCQVKEVNNKEIRKFQEDNHLQGFVGSKTKLGLYYNDILVSIMTFGSLRKSLGQVSSIDVYELLRFCNLLNTSVIGGASKLLKYYITNYKVSNIISYSDISRSNGNMYIKLGFSLSHNSDPNYYWCKNKIRENRFSFRKNILVEQGFDINKSESEIMKDRGYYKIFDCGVQKWTLDLKNN